jgi:tetratricopeptide (TPR) repeat protein
MRGRRGVPRRRRPPRSESDVDEHGASEQLGTVEFAVSCTPKAQAEFNRAAALLHSFWFAPAIEGFKTVVDLDGTCAMGHWGVAMSLLGNPFAWPLTGPALADGRAAVERAIAAGAATQRERSYIDAIGSFYRDAEKVDHTTRALAYAQAMGRLVEDYPDDTEAKIFYALALDATAVPTDKTYANQKKAAEILERIAVDQPDHPGVAHYLIHSYDYPASADKGRHAAERYATIAPSAPHALHMPSHIFTRLGDWDASIRSNVASSRAAKDELAAAHHQGAGSYNALHALDYLMYAYLQESQDAAAAEVFDEINTIQHLDVENFPAAYALAAIPARYALERGQWEQAAGLTLHPADLDWKRFPQAEAVNAFARGLGAARHGDVAAAGEEQERLGVLKAAMVAAKQDYWAGQADIQSATIAAWSAMAGGRGAEALDLMRSASGREAATEKHPVMPGPLFPAREQLGEMLIALNKPAQALAEFEASQQVEPNRFRGLYDAAHAAEMAGDGVKARRYYERLVKVAEKGDGQRPELTAARTYLAKAG